MRKYKLIDFLKEEKREEKYFKCTVIILIYLLSFQLYTNIKHINDLKEEINNNKLSAQTKVIRVNNNKNSTLMKDTNKIYDLLGVSNVDRLVFENNKIYIEGKCKNLKILDKLKSIDNINSFSITSIENKSNKFYFNIVCEIGGFE